MLFHNVHNDTLLLFCPSSYKENRTVGIELQQSTCPSNPLFDILKLIPTPLTGVTHWFPEMMFIFLIGRYVVKKLSRSLVLAVAGCLILYNVLTYALLYNLGGVQFGLGAGSLFSGTFLFGVATAKKRQRPTWVSHLS